MFVYLPVFKTLSLFSNVIIIIIMEICKAPTLRLKALNKHTHIMYIEMENVTKKEEEKRGYIDKCSSIIMQKMHTHTHIYTRTHARTHTRTHTHTLYRLMGVKDNVV